MPLVFSTALLNYCCWKFYLLTIIKCQIYVAYTAIFISGHKRYAEAANLWAKNYSSYLICEYFNSALPVMFKIQLYGLTYRLKYSWRNHVLYEIPHSVTLFGTAIWSEKWFELERIYTNLICCDWSNFNFNEMKANGGNQFSSFLSRIFHICFNYNPQFVSAISLFFYYIMIPITPLFFQHNWRESYIAHD